MPWWPIWSAIWPALISDFSHSLPGFPFQHRSTWPDTRQQLGSIDLTCRRPWLSHHTPNWKSNFHLIASTQNHASHFSSIPVQFYFSNLLQCSHPLYFKTGSRSQTPYSKSWGPSNRKLTLKNSSTTGRLKKTGLPTWFRFCRFFDRLIIFLSKGKPHLNTDRDVPKCLNFAVSCSCQRTKGLLRPKYGSPPWWDWWLKGFQNNSSPPFYAPEQIKENTYENN